MNRIDGTDDLSFSQVFIERLNNLERTALELGTSLTAMCKGIGISRATPDRWRRQIPRTIQIVDQMEAFVEEVSRKKGVIPRKPCYLYRHYDLSDRLLYVGISLRAILRTVDHRATSSWFSEIAYIKLEKFDDIMQARTAERSAIRIEKPLHNIHMNLATSA